jgi:glycosyltransferase involved in cell wall biosynthesis
VITICLTYFRSLTLGNLAAALYSVGRQDLSSVVELVVVDNNTDDSANDIKAVIDAQPLPVPVRFLSYKHGNPARTHAWSTNVAIAQVKTPWVFFTRADYLLDFWAVAKFAAIARAQGDDWSGFVTSNGCHLQDDITECERSDWRVHGPRFCGTVFDYTCIDAGVWMARRDQFDRVGGLNERLTAWGHAQTLFQYKLHSAGTECVRIHETLFFHPWHSGERDLAQAHQQLHDQGVNLKALWARHEGAQPY